MIAVGWLVFLGVLFMQASGADPVSKCTPSWTPYKDCCYSISNDGLDFFEAASFCKARGGKLMQVDSQAKQDFIANELKKVKVDYIYIGGKSRGRAATWGWFPSYQPFVYTNWDDGQPNFTDMERCLLIHVSKGGKWTNLVCSSSYRFICEKCSFQADCVHSSARETFTGVHIFDKMNSKILSDVKMKHPDVDLGYQDMDTDSKETLTGVHIFDKMNSKILSDVKMEHPDDHLGYQDMDKDSKETLTEGQTFDKMDSDIPEGVKTEHPEVYLDYPDFKPVKQEVSGEQCKDKSHRLSRMMDVADCSFFQEIPGGSNTEPLVTERDYKVFFNLENCSHTSKKMSSENDININPSLVSENFHFENMKPVVNYKHIYRSFDSTVDCNIHPKIQTYTMDGCDLGINAEKKTEKMEKPYKQQVCLATEADHLMNILRAQSEENLHSCDDYVTSYKGVRPYKYDVCGSSSAEADNLKSHTERHTGEKTYTRDVCDISVTAQCSLKLHKRTHTGEKPYTCEICGASFTHTRMLKVHRKTHTDEKPYICDVCDSSFPTAGSLICHKKTHTGEKPYKCGVCGASFSQAGDLQKHKRSHTGEKPHTCDVCFVSCTQAGDLRCCMG